MKICFSCGNRFAADDFQCPICGYQPERRDGHFLFAPEIADGVDPTILDQLFGLEDGNFWFETRNRLINWALSRYFPKTKTFFEVGCGTGFVLSGIQKRSQGMKLYGSDIVNASFRYVQHRIPEAVFFQADAQKQIPFEDEFNVIGAFDVLEHIRDDEAALKQMYQACKNKGGIILTVPQHTFLWSYMDEYSHHVRRYTARELKTKVEQAGFQILRTTSFVSILLPVMIISRLTKRKHRFGFSPTSELRIAGLLNIMLERVLDLERYIIRSGFSFPVGGSLLLVARKSSGPES